MKITINNKTVEMITREERKVNPMLFNGHHPLDLLQYIEILEEGATVNVAMYCYKQLVDAKVI